MTKPTSEKWRERFDKKFTCVVTYEKWPDEDEAQRLREPVYRWTDEARENPKLVLAFIQEELTNQKKEIKEEVLNEVRDHLTSEGGGIEAVYEYLGFKVSDRNENVR